MKVNRKGLPEAVRLDVHDRHCGIDFDRARNLDPSCDQRTLKLARRKRPADHGRPHRKLRNARVMRGHLAGRIGRKRHPVIHAIGDPGVGAVGNGAPEHDQIRTRFERAQDPRAPVIRHDAMVLGECNDIACRRSQPGGATLEQIGARKVPHAWYRHGDRCGGLHEYWLLPSAGRADGAMGYARICPDRLPYGSAGRDDDLKC